MEKFISQHGVHRCLVFQINTEREIQRERKKTNYTTSPDRFCGKQSVLTFQSYANKMLLALFNCVKTEMSLLALDVYDPTHVMIGQMLYGARVHCLANWLSTRAHRSCFRNNTMLCLHAARISCFITNWLMV